MRELNLTLDKSQRPVYRKLADAIRRAIRRGQLRPGEVLPSSRKIAEHFRIHRHTVMSALDELRAEGWIAATEKKNYQVVPTLPSTYLRPATTRPSRALFKSRTTRAARTVDLESYPASHSFQHAFPSGFPDVRLFPMAEFKSHLYDALGSKHILGYGDPAGHPKLITQVESYLRRLRGVVDREILITNGSQEGLFLLAQLLVRPGDFVAVEKFGYPPALEALKFAGANLVPIDVDQEGLVVEDLVKTLKSKKIRLLYVTPLHQYPTTVTLSARRRLHLYEVAYRHDILIIEDDYDHEFHFVSQPVAPLASFDPGGIILYVSTFSKILFPSARVGFMALPKTLAVEAAKLKRICSRQNEQIMQFAIAKWMESGGFERHLRKMRRTYEERRNGMLATLRDLAVQNPALRWKDPDGGMAIWLDVGRDSDRVAQMAQRHSIAVAPESRFQLRKTLGTHLRLGYSGQTVSENNAGLRALAKVLEGDL